MKKYLLTQAVLTALVCTPLIAGADLVSSQQTTLRLKILGTTQCSDDIDNDSDGHIDFPDDSDCTGYADDDERAASAGGGSGGGGGGGGGGGTGILAAPTSGSVIFSGLSYPGSTVTLLRSGVIAATTRVGADATFQIRIDGLSAGLGLFSIFSEDENGNRSPAIPIPVSASLGSVIDVSGMFLAPTISTDLIQVRQGDPVTILGKSIPSSDITITVHSARTVLLSTHSDATGAYAYTYITDNLETGDHTAVARASRGSQVSDQGSMVHFTVGTDNLPRPKNQTTTACAMRRGDVNCDGKVNLVDFSIVAFWYKKQGAPAKVDINHDGKVTLSDLSIMAFNWTG